ncbi:FAD-binding protein [Turicimonas muris]|uniref:FAD-binding protein n=1 Tax=Turicimonas muris TaxID=1796652 RepID=UPI00248C1D9F|nr:FAD-binding protein [Turicimonas muris]
MLRRTVLALPSLFLSPTPADRFLSSADASEFIKKETFQLPGDVELLIIGSGVAGLSCAVRTAELGDKSILLVEREPLIVDSDTVDDGRACISEDKTAGVME